VRERPTADERFAALAALSDGVSTRRLAAKSGLDARAVARRVANGVLDEPAPGVLRFTAAPRTWRQEVRVAVLGAGRGAAASHRSGGRLHDLDGMDDDVVEVSIPGSRRVRLKDVVVHRVKALDPSDLIVVDGILTTGLARTLADLGSVCEEERVLRAFDDVVRRGTSRLWLRQTAERLHRPGQSGTGVLLRLLDRTAGERRPPESWFERLVALCLASPELPELVLQYEVRGPGGRVVARLDGAFPELRLGIEAHSRAFHFGPVAEAWDEERDLELAAMGWEVLYLGWRHAVETPERTLVYVVRAARARGHAAGV
jgi:hypothetical protein